MNLHGIWLHMYWHDIINSTWLIHKKSDQIGTIYANCILVLKKVKFKSSLINVLCFSFPYFLPLFFNLPLVMIIYLK